MTLWLKKHWPLVLILTLAAALRVTLLFFRGTLWFDELFSIHFSTLDPGREAWRLWTLETNPPLYLMFMRFYLALGDAGNPFFTRAPAVVFGLIGVYLIYQLGKRMFSAPAGLLASLLLALSGIHILTSAETRSYTLLTLLTLISSYLFYRLIIAGETKKWLWPGYAVVTVLLFYTHLTAVVVVVGQLLSLILVAPDRPTRQRWWLVQGLAIVAWLPWLITWFVSKFNTRLAGGWFFDPNLFGHANFFSLITTGFFVDNLGGKFIYTLVMLILVFGLIKLAEKIKDKNLPPVTKNTLFYLLLWALLPIIATSLLGVFVPKYVLFAYPALYLLAGYTLTEYLKTKKQLATAAAIIIFIMLPSATILATTTAFSWQPFVDYIETHETPRSFTLLAFPETLAFNHFYRGPRPVVGIYLQDDNLSYEERIVRFNWNKQLTNEAELTNWITTQIDKYQADKIFLIFNYINYSWIQEILLKHGWTISHKERAPGYSEAHLYEMNAPAENIKT